MTPSKPAGLPGQPASNRTFLFTKAFLEDDVMLLMGGIRLQEKWNVCCGSIRHVRNFDSCCRVKSLFNIFLYYYSVVFTVIRRQNVIFWLFLIWQNPLCCRENTVQYSKHFIRSKIAIIWDNKTLQEDEKHIQLLPSKLLSRMLCCAWP